MPTLDAPVGTPAADAVLLRARGENFPVALRLLGPRTRMDLLAIYGFARLVDELGDSYAGDRLAALDWVQEELGRAFQGTARHPLLMALTPALHRHALTPEPFVRLIEANRMDQRVARYETWEQLRGYCSLSADPVGELVLAMFGVRDQRRIELSNSVCTALQLAEHCQDVAEDLASGRIYLPAEDLRRFDVAESDLAAAHAGPAVRGLVAFELGRARELLRAGAQLVGELPLRAGFAVAAFIAGGRAALDAIERADCDVLAGSPRPTRLMLARELLVGLGERRRGVAGRARP